MKVLKNYLYNAIYQIFKVLIPFITIPYLSRVLGPSGIGINSYTNAIIQYFVYLSDLGITMYGNRKIAYVRDNKYKLTQTFYEIMIMQICTVIFAYFTFFIFLNFSSSFYRPYYLAQSIMILSMAFDISWFFMGVENFKITVFRNFVVRLIILFMIFVFVKSYRDLMLYIILYALSYVIGNITLFVSLRKYIGLPNLKDLHIWQHFWPAIMLFIPQIAGQVYGILNKNILGLLDSSKSVGYFDQADKVDTMILAVVTATGTVMLPHVAHAFSKGEMNKTKKYLYDSFSLVTALSVPIAFGISAIAFKFVPLFFTNKFIIVAPLMIIEAVTIVLVAWSNAIGIQYLLPTKQTNAYTISITAGAVTNIALDMPLIIFFGVVGSTVAYVMSELSVTGIQLYLVKDQISYKKLFTNLYKYIISGAIMFLVVFLLDKALPMSWLMVIIETCIGFVIYMGLIFIMKANIFNVVKRMIQSR